MYHFLQVQYDIILVSSVFRISSVRIICANKPEVIATVQMKGSLWPFVYPRNKLSIAWSASPRELSASSSSSTLSPVPRTAQSLLLHLFRLHGRSIENILVCGIKHAVRFDSRVQEFRKVH